MTAPPCRLTDPRKPEPKCTCLRFLGKVVPCRHHRKPPRLDDITMTVMPQGGYSAHVVAAAVILAGQPEPDWMRD